MFYDIYYSLCKSVGKSPSKVAIECGISKSAVSTWKSGRSKPQTEQLQKIAEYFNISVDSLLTGDIVENKKTPALNSKDERDIAKDLEKLRENLESGAGLMFDGDPLSDEAKESILAAMKIGLEMAKAKNKAKYTPKKYRKDTEND